MYQPWSTGRHLLQKFSFKGINYQCAFQAQKDEPTALLWWTWVCTGDCFAQHPVIVIDPSDSIAFTGTDTGKTPEVYVREVMAKINKYLQDYYGDIIPVTYGEKVEQLIQQMSISNASGIPQFVLDADREWGNNPAKNKWMSQKTGYTGPFSDGQFASWCTLNGYNIEALVAEYEAA
jgi:hypothetical protein